MKKPILLALLIAVSSQAWAAGGKTRSEGVYFEETFFPVYVSKNDTESQAGGSATRAVPTQTGWGIDTRTTLGYVWRSMLLGLSYNYYNVSSNRSRTPDYEGLDELTSKSEYGVTIGYLATHLRFTFTYFFSGTKNFTQKYTDAVSGAVTTDETHENAGANGFQIGIGYDFALGAGWGVSPTLLYRSVTYGRQSYSVRMGTGTPYTMMDLTTKAIDDGLQPMLTINSVF